MAEFNIRTDAVDVEQIMRQIRARIQAKRGVDYTEEQIQELANVKLERFLDAKGVRSDLVEQFKRARDRKLEPFEPEQYGFDANLLYGSHRFFVRFMRRLLNPFLKLLFNPNTVIQVLDQQTRINALYEKQFYLLRDKTQQRDEVDALYYELVHNLVLELTRIGIENRNLKMRLESLSSRMDFDERRARALERVVQYRPGTGPAREPQPTRQRSEDRVPAPERIPTPPPGGSMPPPSTGPAPVSPPPAASTEAPDQAGDSNTARRRRRRRRGRRGGRGRPTGDLSAAASEVTSADASATPPHGDPTADAALTPDGDASDFGDSDSGDDAEPESSQ
jgi:hypothetical protein